MRHTITLHGSSEKKGQRVHCKKLQNLQEDSIVKIQQNNHKIYAIFTPTQSCEKAQISASYLKLNFFQESIATITKIQIPPKLKTVEIDLSPIDYQLVNNNFDLLERTFLDQVNILWPGAKIPLFYNDSNSITLIPKVKDLYLVDPYSAISFNMIQESPNMNVNKSEDNCLEDEEQLGNKVLLLKKLERQSILDFGYANKIYLGRQIFESFKKFYNHKEMNLFLCTVQPIIPFTTSPSFEEFLEYKKIEEASQLPQLKPILVQFLPFTQNMISKLENQTKNEIPFICSQICKNILSLPEKILLNEETIKSFEVSETLSIEIFIKELQSKKYQIQLSVVEQINLSKQQETELRNKFATKLSQALMTDKEFIFLQNYYPFFIQNHIYYLSLSKKSQKGTQYENLKHFFMIRNTNDQKNIENINEKMDKITKVFAENIILSRSEFDKVKKWLPIIKSLSQKRNQKKTQHNFKRVFKTCYDQELKKCIHFIKIERQKQFSSSKILFATYSSNGKTFLHQYLHNQDNLQSWFLDCRTLIHQNNRFDQIKEYLSAFVSLCPYKIIFFDNIEVLVPLIEEGDQMRQKEKTLSQVFAIFINKILETHGKIGIFTAKSQANINPVLKFDKVFKLKNPNRQTRAQILSILSINADKNWINEFVDKTESLSLGAFTHYLNQRQIPIKKQQKRKNDFSMIVGLEEAKKTIRSVIQKPNKFGFIYDKVKIKVPRGILLYGATGNGKTALGSSVEDEFPMKFFSVKGSDILSKYIGGSEAAVREVFEKALSVSPSIIFFDQFESIVPRRNSSGTGVTDRVVNQFLCYLDGVSSTTGVFIIAASSRPDLIDPALLRPGRIDSHVHLDYPNPSERAQILKMFENSVKLEVNEQEFVKTTENYSYSDLLGLLKELRIKKSSQVLKSNQNIEPQDFKYIDKELFDRTVKGYRIGTEINEQKKQKQLYERFKSVKGPEIKKQKFVQM